MLFISEVRAHAILEERTCLKRHLRLDSKVVREPGPRSAKQNKHKNQLNQGFGSSSVGKQGKTEGNLDIRGKHTAGSQLLGYGFWLQ